MKTTTEVNAHVRENHKWKVFYSPDYNFVFNKTNGQFARWGRRKADDPRMAPAPEILDLEISIDGCPNACSFCSPAGTKVNLPNSTKNIEDIKVGDIVWGHGSNQPGLFPQEVQEIYNREYNGELIAIELESGELLELTPNHSVFLKDGTEKPAGSLTENDELMGMP